MKVEWKYGIAIAGAVVLIQLLLNKKSSDQIPVQTSSDIPPNTALLYSGAQQYASESNANELAAARDIALQSIIAEGQQNASGLASITAILGSAASNLSASQSSADALLAAVASSRPATEAVAGMQDTSVANIVTLGSNLSLVAGQQYSDTVNTIWGYHPTAALEAAVYSRQATDIISNIPLLSGQITDTAVGGLTARANIQQAANTSSVTGTSNQYTTGSHNVQSNNIDQILQTGGTVASSLINAIASNYKSSQTSGQTSSGNTSRTSTQTSDNNTSDISAISNVISPALAALSAVF